MKKSARFQPKTKFMMLAPVFAVLAACGGGDFASTDETSMSLAEVDVAVRPTDYAPDSAATGAAELPVTTPAADGQAIDGAPQVAVNAASGNTMLASTVVVEARDPLKQPFSSNSIWNMPIGSGARFVPAGLNPNPGNNIWAAIPGIDDEKLILKPTAPLVNISYSSAAWTGQNRCAATGAVMYQVPMPSNYIIPNTNKNSSAVFLLKDGRTLVQTQPVARCTAGGPATAYAKFTNVDLYGTGITGAHGGSGLSAIGGSIRLGELRPGSTTGPRHALKVNVYAKEALFKCTTRSACSRWPATTSDSYAVGWYGSASKNSNSAMKMGALLAIPGTTSIASMGLETLPAKQLAWTLQNYGAYIVDDTYAAGFDFSAEDGPDGSKRDEFKRDWGFDMSQKVQGASPWMRDIQRIMKALNVVDNNSATSIGGGGTPRQALAAALAK